MFNSLKTAALALGVAAAGLALPGQGHAADWKMATGYPDSSYLTETVKGFIADISASTDGGISVTLHNNQSLVKLQDIPNAVRRNQVALGQVYTANLGNQNAMFTLDAIPFLAPDSESAMKLWEAQKPYFEEWFARQNMRVLFPAFFPPQGFYTDAQVATKADLEGLSLRIYSDSTQRMAQLLGAKPLQVQFGEVPQAFATGLVNAMFTSPQTGIDVQAWDFTSNYNMVGAMRTKLIVVVNEDEFQKLSDAEKQAVLEAAERARIAGMELGNKVSEEQLATLEEKGITVTHASDAFTTELEEIGKVMVGEWREKADEKQREVLDAYLASRN
ncbi:TRAP transporter substrate-binding protein [Oceanibium sediminis]|uniref:TRAP transporter substrate-binding protein n=1 Tax=Oceanibium sediminis TaxID=2026339 RepID=UPI0013003F1B|nr:TRAP transporter substrate-binding protein [Oceanibium sediminis]